MAVVTSGDEVMMEAVEGTEANIEFTVENQSEIAWPFKPYLQNEKDRLQRQCVDKILQPGESTVVSYTFTVPKGQKEKFYIIRLQFVDPYKYEKFDEQTLIGFCQIKPPVVPSFNAEDMQQIHKNARPFRNTFQVSELSDQERFSQESYPVSVKEEETDLFQFDPRARADMIDRAL